jgi:alpha-tubulin suppressor-like RCC1 family protein
MTSKAGMQLAAPEMWAVGLNNFGQLGLNPSEQDYCQPSHVPVLFGSGAINGADVKQLACGSTYTVVVKSNGSILITGSLNGIFFPRLSPVVVSYSLKCTQVACGRKHILALMEGGFVLSWGMGYFGQLGHGDDSSWEQPRLIHSLKPNEIGSPAVQVACGFHHSGVVTAEGRLFMWGLNRNYQCGTGIKSENLSSPRPVEMKNVGQAAKLVCGRNHSAAVNKYGAVYTWGASGFGRLGLMDTPKNVPIPLAVAAFSKRPVKDIASGDFHMLALCPDGTVYSWGCG